MKSLVFLSFLVLCTACTPLSISTVGPTATLSATNESTSGSSPNHISTPTLLFPSPTPIFDVVIDNVAMSQQGQLYASGFGTMGDDVRHFAQWDGAKWIPLGNGYSTAGNTLVADGAGYLYSEILKDSGQGMATAVMSGIVPSGKT
jgi:hypothetical protein